MGSLKATAPLVAFRLPIPPGHATRSNSLCRGTRLVVAVRLLFDDARPQRGIDPPLDSRPLVVFKVDGPRQADEFRIEGLGAFLVADVVFDHPQALVDGEQCAEVGLYVDL